VSAVLSVDVIARLQPLVGLGAESLKQAAQLGHVEAHPHGAALPFAWKDKLVYLLRGEAKLDFPDGDIKVLVGGCDEAMAPLTLRRRKPVMLKAITDIELLWFDENALDILVTWDQLLPPNDGEASESGLGEMRRLALGAFVHLPAAHIDSLLACFRRQSVRAGQTIVRQGDPGDYYYLIGRGRAEVTREVAGARIALAQLEAGDAFGEEALVAETVRNATVSMKTDGELLRLDGADFVRLLREPLLQRVSAAEAVQRVAAGAIWLDVRFPAEYRYDGLPGAINIPLNELREALPSLRRDTEYLVYCQTGRRSSAAAFLLSQRGMRASLVEGGLSSVTDLEKIAA